MQLLFDEGIIQPTTAYGYESPPILHFIPVDQQGGGARAEVIVSRGQIIDIVLVNPGSGYTKPPKVVTAKQYEIIKQRGRKFDSFVTLEVRSQIQVDRVTGIFREGIGITGLSRNNTAVVDAINYTEFNASIRSYYDNMGYYESDYGKVSDANQKIHDSFYYQDYSYEVIVGNSLTSYIDLFHHNKNL